MREFGDDRAVDVSGAVALLDGDPGARFLGGGTNLVDVMKTGVDRLDERDDIERGGVDPATAVNPADSGNLPVQLNVAAAVDQHCPVEGADGRQIISRC